MTEKTTYALLIYRTSPAEPDPERSEKALEAHRALQRQTSQAGDVHAVARLDESVGAKTVQRRGNAHEV